MSPVRRSPVTQSGSWRRSRPSPVQSSPVQSSPAQSSSVQRISDFLTSEQQYDSKIGNMKIRVFTIALANPSAGTAALDEFLAGHLAVHVDREFVSDGRNGFWTICICAEEMPADSRATPLKTGAAANAKVDYREVLSPDDFVVFARLRSLRSSLAMRDGVPVYGVLNNQQLAEIAIRRPATIAQIGEIQGIGATRAQKYGNDLLTVVRELSKPKPADSATATNLPKPSPPSAATVGTPDSQK